PIDILHQRIQLDLTQGNTIRGACTIQLVPRSEVLTSFDLDLEALTVDSITSTTGTWSHEQQGITLTVIPDAPIGPEHTVVFTVHYAGDPGVDGSGFGGFYTSPGLLYNLGVAFESVPHSYGRTWFPCLDNFTERSTYEFFIRTAGGKKAWCNGVLVERSALGGDTLINHWRCAGTMPAYLASVAAADYTVARDTFSTVVGGEVPVELIADASDTAQLRSSFTHLADAFAHFEELFGPYRWEKVGYVLTPNGAMEHSTSIHYPASIADGSLDYETTMAHELAHHWFGNLVTCERAEEMYLNEGFAEFLSYLFLEDVYGRDRYMEEVRSNHRAMVQRAHLADEGWWALSEMPQAWTYGTHSYNKGADVLHTLRSYMGDDAFREGLTSFLATHGFQPVNTTMLQEHLGMTSGLDLSDYFTDWIRQPGWAAFEIDEQMITPGEEGWIVQLTVGQKQRGPSAPYHNVPITVAILGTAPDQVVRDTVMVGGSSTELTMTVPFEPAFVWLNDDDRLSLACTGSTHTVTTTAPITSIQSNLELRPRVGPPTLVRMEQYWVAADQGEFAEPFAYVISPDRYWRLTGTWTDPQRFAARLNFDGRDNLNTFDPLLMQDSLGVTFHEDSLVLLHRSGPGAPWVRWSDVVFSLGSTTDGFGRLELDSVAPGEYALAWRTSPVAITDPTAPHAVVIAPNPADDHIEVDMGTPGPGRTLIVLDAAGHIVLRIAASDTRVRLSTSGLANGAYTIDIQDRTGGPLTIGRFVVQH
ncbi:MAG: M1 family aminopeptidase, partial [Flavobacteriales bacterium]